MQNKAKAVFVFAHPDDAEITSYGTIRYYLEKGYSVDVVIVTNGNNGISVTEKEKTGNLYIENEVRKTETRNSFKDIDVNIIFLDIPQEKVLFNIEIVTKLESVLIKLQPEILVTHFLDITGNDHQEHCEISKIVTNISNRIDSLKLFMMAEPIKSFKCHFVPNYFIDITKYIDAKCESLQHHITQKERFYMSREFHLMRCRKNALVFNSSDFINGKLYEGFHIQRSVFL